VEVVGTLTFTYSGDPSANSRDKVRFLIHDTTSTTAQVTDEEIAWALSSEGNNYYKAAAVCARAIAAGLRASDSVTVGDVSESGGGAEEWDRLAAELDRKGVSLASCPSPFLGGASVDRRADNAGDTDRTMPRHWFGQFDDPPVSLTSTSTSQP
jgi:hypothetical protein